MFPVSEDLVIQGRHIKPQDIERIRKLVSSHPDWSRRRLSEVLCAEWDWRNGAGRLKDMATRSLLLKLEARGLIELPARRRKATNRMASQHKQLRLWDLTRLEGTLREVGPLTIQEVSSDKGERAEFAAALAQFHYLGYRGTVGENLQYTVRDDKGRLLGCLLFGSAAWKCLPRDRFIGWQGEQRERQLYLLTNNTRFLILPFVRVAHLASWTLGRVLRRLSSDWEKKYGHPILLVETFVERERFVGTSYRASNWTRLGSTTGRSRQDRDHTLAVAIKDVYVYPLQRRFREGLCR
jgi:hypothetical protein